ncbi:MAG: Hint domain-containing protein [Pseudomonadota bacterium]
MPDYTFEVYRRVDIGGTDGLETAGTITVRDDDGFRDDFFDDIEQAPSSETNGDQEIIASSVSELSVSDTIRTRGIFRFTNTATSDTYDVREIFSNTAGNPIERLFIFTSPPPPWVFDTTSRTFALLNSDGTLAYSDILCFAAGTLIETADGRQAGVETLRVGDRIRTQTGGAQTLRWIGSHTITGAALMLRPKLSPIRIRAGALGPGYPNADLLVSRQHRVLIRSVIAQRMFGSADVLVPAIRLTQLDQIDIATDVPEVTYVHLLFDDHHVIRSNGAWTESLFTGPEALKSVSPAAREEIATLFPQITDPAFRPVPARPIPARGKDIRRLVHRHRKNRKPLFAAA